jgi:CubicO group peptidase (beta-lactamase class C family)
VKNKSNQSVLNELTQKAAAKKQIFGAVLYVSSDDKSVDIISAAGNIQKDSQYYIASINKLFVSALLLKLYSDSKLDINDKISHYLSAETIKGLHIYKGEDYSQDLTIEHLMSHTSGLPCYLMDKHPDGKKAMSELEAGIDQAWPTEKVIQVVKQMKSHFAPGTPRKAKYSDTNFQILSLVIEHIVGNPINIILEELFGELKMTNTYVCTDVNDTKYVPIRSKLKEIRVPLFLTSTKNDIISTARDQMVFIKAFFNGHFFPKERMKELAKWNSIFFPFKYGIGIQKFSLPRVFTLFQRVPDMIGHSGSVGSVAFYVPDLNIYITGTVNQQAKPSAAFQTMIKIVNAIRHK